MQRIPPIVCLLPVVFLPAVAQWTTPVPLTTGAGDDNNPALVNTSPSLRGWSVWAGNPAGTWKLFGSTSTISLGAVNDNGLIAAEVHLSQNYPNPFNSSTRIEYYLPHAVFVTLKVYDLLGREVRALVQAKKDPGKHRISFDADGLPSGVYFCRLQSGDYASTRKLVVVR